MAANPIVQTVMLFLGAYTVSTMLKRYDPLGLIITLFAGVTAVTIWMCRYERAQLAQAYRHAALKPLIDLVCTIAQEQPPVDGVDDQVPLLSSAAGSSAAVATPVGPSTTAPARPRQVISARGYSHNQSGPAPQAATAAKPSDASPLLLVTDSDVRLASHEIKQRLAGLDDHIEQTLRQLERNLRIRENGLPATLLPPVGMFLFMGRHGLGKRTLAVEIGRRLYRGGPVGTLDLQQPDITLESVMMAARTNPFQTFVLENVDLAPRRVQDELLTIVAGQGLVDPAHGTRVGFRHCCLFLLVHKDADQMPAPVMSIGNAGFTVAVEHTTGETAIDVMLAQAVHGFVPFHLPDRQKQAQAVASLMDLECRKYQLELVHVKPSILAREVQEVSAIGSFRTMPARVSRVLSGPIHEAIRSKRTTVTVA